MRLIYLRDLASTNMIGLFERRRLYNMIGLFERPRLYKYDWSI